MAYQAYHSIKLGNRELVDRAVESGEFSDVHGLLYRELCAIASDPMYKCLRRG